LFNYVTTEHTQSQGFTPLPSRKPEGSPAVYILPSILIYFTQNRNTLPPPITEMLYADANTQKY